MHRPWGLHGSVTALALACLVAAPGCKDSHDDPNDLYVVSVVPGDQQTNTPTGSLVTLRFSTIVDLASAGSNQVILVDQSNSLQPISIAYGSSTEFLVITPVTPLQPNLTYGVAVREGVKSDLGEPIEAPFSMTFSTGATLSTIPGFPPFLTGSLIPPTAGAPGTFTLTGQLTTPRSRHTATRLQSGDVLVTGGASPRRVSAGGTTLRSAEVYSPTTGSWRSVRGDGTPLGMFYARYGHTATLLNTGQVLLAGGWDERTIWDTAELYDPVADNFAPTPGRMNGTTTFHTATALGNGNVLIAGGFTNAGSQGGIFSGNEVYDVPSGTFIITQNFMQWARCYHSSVLLGDGNSVLIAGGIVPWFGLGPAVTTSSEVYKPDLVNSVGQQGSMSPSGSMSDGRMNFTLTLFTSGLTAGLVVATGGANGFDKAEIYDPNITITGGNKGDWALVADDMAVRRRAHTANLIEKGPDIGKLVVIGGTSRLPTNGVLYLAPHSWASTESHNCRFCATTITAEIFDPFGFGQFLSGAWKGIDVTGRFTRTQDQQGNLTAMVGVPVNPVGNGGRYFHTATTLRSGHVLVAGGWDCPFCSPLGPTFSGPETALATTELYNP